MWTVAHLGRHTQAQELRGSLRPVHGGAIPDPAAQALGAERDRAAPPQWRRVAACGRAAWLAPWDQETETGREESGRR